MTLSNLDILKSRSLNFDATRKVVVDVRSLVLYMIMVLTNSNNEVEGKVRLY